jgi:Do/DeqQ family serine protease
MFRRLFFSLMVLIAGFAAGLVVSGRTNGMTSSFGSPLPAERPERDAPRAEGTTGAQAPPEVAPAGSPLASPGVTAGGPDFTRVAAAAVKGVANISSIQVVRTPNSPFASDPFFRYFFGDRDDMLGSQNRRSLSLGSGVVVSADGYVVTNNHVIGENNRSREVSLALSDKREIKGRIVGVDPATDIALLKIDVGGLPFVQWGDSDKLLVGEWVLAIGSPFQLSQTVTAGIVSATGRANVGFAEYEDFIQTDAAINPGNSGGALINSRGELIGINTGIFSQSGGYQGIGFAVPSKLARHVIDDLMKFGAVQRGTIGGISVDRLTPQLAEEVGAPNTNGAVVVRMQRNAEAYNAGVRPGDVIVGFNGRPVDDPSQLYRYVADARVGSTAAITVLRSGRTVDLKVPIVADPRTRQQ